MCMNPKSVSGYCISGEISSKHFFFLSQMRPPLPPTPPPPYGYQSVYSEDQYRPYLHVLPDSDHVMVRGPYILSVQLNKHVLQLFVMFFQTNGRCAPRLGPHPRESSQNETSSNTEVTSSVLQLRVLCEHSFSSFANWETTCFCKGNQHDAEMVEKSVK